MGIKMEDQATGDKHSKEKDVPSRDKFKTGYMIFYNLSQVFGFTYVIVVIILRYLQLGYESLHTTFDRLGQTMKFLHAMQLLETLHPVLGLAKGGPFMPFAQIIGRLFMCFVMFNYEPKMAAKPVVPYLFFIWSLIEIIRHLFYYTRLRKKDYPLLTFLRYHAWIILYPMGISGETYTMVSNIKNFQESQIFNVSMPNDWNWTYNMPTHLKIHTVILCGPGVILLMGHMYRMMKKSQRKAQIKVKDN